MSCIRQAFSTIATTSGTALIDRSCLLYNLVAILFAKVLPKSETSRECVSLVRTLEFDSREKT